ncbi:MAG TPA: YrzA family protein [Chondromyces sp.]|nr:YrzA family protein [Chondromyces sp.]
MAFRLDLDLIEDKIEFFEANDLASLEKKIDEKIEQNKAIMLSVHSVSHQMQFDPDGRKHYSAVVHFKAKR